MKFKNMKLNKIFVILFFSIFFLNFVSSTITLDNLNVSYSENWSYDNKGFVYVYSLDNESNFFEIENLTIEIINKSINFTESEIFRFGEGRYKKWFIINEKDIFNFTINVSATQSWKNIEKQVIVSIHKNSKFYIFKRQIKEDIERVVIFVSKNLIYFLFSFLGLFLIWLFFIIIKLMKGG